MSNDSKTFRLLILVLLLIITFPLTTLAQTKPVTNTKTGEYFVTIQAAIDDPDTADGHIIKVNSSTYDSANELGGHPFGGGQALILIDKSVTIRSTGGAEQTIIDGKSHKIVIAISEGNVTLEGFTVTGAELPSGDNWAAGIHTSAVTEKITIANNIVSENESSGINLHRTQSCVVKKNTITNNLQPTNMEYSGYGVVINRSDNNIVRDNEILDNRDEGISFNGSSSNIIENNQLRGNADHGIKIASAIDWETHKVEKVSKKNELVGNRIVGNGGKGIGVYGSSFNFIRANDVKENGNKGVTIEPSFDWNDKEIVRASDENELLNNDILDNQSIGINIAGASNNVITSNLVTGNKDFGIRVSAFRHPDDDSLVSQADGNGVKGNTVKETVRPKDSWTGIGIIIGQGAKNNNVESNEVTNNYTGVLLQDKAEKNSVKNNVVTRNGDGLSAQKASDNNLLKGNEVTDNDKNGIEILGASFNEIQGNEVDGNGARGIRIEAWVDLEAHEVIFSSQSNEIVNNDITNNKETGIELKGSSKNLIEGNLVDNNSEIGVYIHPLWGKNGENILKNSNKNDIVDNVIINTSRVNWNWAGQGIHITHGPKNNLVANNTVGNNYKGIGLWKVTGSVVENNEVFGAEVLGIGVSQESHDNIIRGNYLHENGRIGIISTGNSSGNTIVDNQIVKTRLVEDDGDVLGIGLYLLAFSNISIKDNVIRDNAFGVIAASNEGGALIKKNKVEGNTDGQFGMLHFLRKNEDVRWSFLSSFEGGGGLYLSGKNIEVVDNIITGNGFGVEFSYGSEDNLVKNNTIRNNSSGNTTLSIRKSEQTTTNSGTLQKEINLLSPTHNLTTQSIQPQAWEPVKTLEVAQPGSFGLLLANASSTLVEDNVFGNNGDNGVTMGGFSLPEYNLSGQSSQNRYVSNVIQENYTGIHLGPYSEKNYFEKNQVKKNTVGISNRKKTTGNCFSRNSILGNMDYGAKNVNTGVLDATENWWGDASGPYHPEKNPDGKGDDVSDGVKFDPCLEISPFETATTFVPGWNLFSPPGIPQNPDPSTALGDDIDPLSLFYNYSNGSYTTYSDSHTQLTWQQAYWTRVGKDIPVDMLVEEQAKDTTLEFTEKGWKMIGVPYETDWSQANFSEPSDFQTDGAGNVRLVSWDSTNGRYLNHYSDDPHVLNDWFGYWVKVEEASPSDMASVSFNRTDQKACTVGTETPLPEAVDESELDYPPLPTETADSLQVLAYPNPLTQKDRVTFTTQVGKAEEIKVTVRNTTGKVVFDSEYKSGNKLFWNLKNTTGNEVANGIYLYQILARGTDATPQSSKVKTLLVLR